MNCIVAVDEKWNIGRGDQLLARIPADQKFFRSMTVGKIVICGRKTLESFPGKKPLPGRHHIVVSSRPDYLVEGAVVVHSPEEAAAAAREAAKQQGLSEDDIFVIGGGQIYREMLGCCDKAYVTRIEYTYDADTSFPDLEKEEGWKLTERSEEQTYFDLVYTFDIWENEKNR